MDGGRHRCCQGRAASTRLERWRLGETRRAIPQHGVVDGGLRVPGDLPHVCVGGTSGLCPGGFIPVQVRGRSDEATP